MNVAPGIAASIVVGSLLTTMQVKDIPYTVALSSATMARQESLVQAAGSLTQSSFKPTISPYRSGSESIILGDSGTKVYLQPKLPSIISELPPAAIEHAELRIPVRQRFASTRHGSVAFGGYRILQPWSQGSGSSFNPPATASAAIATGTLYYEALGAPNQSAGTSGSVELTTVNGSNQNLSLDITWLVRQWLADGRNYGIMVHENNTADTNGLWWEAPRGAQPELVVTVHQQYLPKTRPVAPSVKPTPPPAPPSDPPAPPSEPHQQPVTAAPIPFERVPVGFTLGGVSFSETMAVKTGPNTPEMIGASGIKIKGTLSIGPVELVMEGGGGQAQSLSGSSIDKPFIGGNTGSFTMAGSVALPVGDHVQIVPGLGLVFTEHSLEYGSNTERIDHTQALAGLMLASELRWRLFPQVELGGRVAALPVAARNESFRHSQGNTWVMESTDNIFTCGIETQLNANVQVASGFALSVGYTTGASIAPAQTATYSYSDSVGNMIPGEVSVSQTSTLSHGWHVGAVYRF